MNLTVLTKTYPTPAFNEKEALRYAGCSKADERTQTLLNECLKEVEDKLCYKVCYCEFGLEIKDTVCDFGVLRLNSKNLADNLAGCDRVIIFSATVGIEIDRLIAKYSRISPSKALIIQAIGAERIEALCDMFCDDIKSERDVNIHPRFSPGYGDLPIEAQKDIISVLDSARRIGVALNDSMLMSPSKSVTAFIGIEY